MGRGEWGERGGYLDLVVIDREEVGCVQDIEFSAVEEAKVGRVVLADVGKDRGAGGAGHGGGEERGKGRLQSLAWCLVR